jgi:hypothetical protein
MLFCLKKTASHHGISTTPEEFTGYVFQYILHAFLVHGIVLCGVRGKYVDNFVQ